MPVLDITNFSTVAIKTSTGNIQMVDYQDEAEVVSRIGFLGDSATKYDVDGTSAADVRLGVVTARFKITPVNKGMWALYNSYIDLETMRGKVGKLKGMRYGESSNHLFSCTARCVLVQMDRYSVKQAPPLASGRRQQMFAVIRWELLSSWNITSI